MDGYGIKLYKRIMRYRHLIILALTLLCLVGCENGKKHTEEDEQAFWDEELDD